MAEGEDAKRLLVLLRHAAATPADGGMADADRALTDHGRTNATAVGAWLARQDWRPDVVLCSPARRTRETWHRVALGMSPSVDSAPVPPGPLVRYESAIYEGRPGALLKLVRGIGPEAWVVLLVGHNPGISELSSLLDQVGGETEGLETAGAAVHGVEAAWADLGPGNAPIISRYTGRG